MEEHRVRPLRRRSHRTRSAPVASAHQQKRPIISTSTSSALADLSAAGVSIWLDDLSRQRIESGNLASLIEDSEVVGVTSNPTIFASAFADADHYAEDLDALAARGASVEDAIRELTTEDVRRACDVFREVWQRTGGVDGRVSLEVDPGKAHDTEGTVAEAADLWKT
ncbi:transaldolase family protein, partial [Actinomycetospora chibensis]